ncbi:MAG: VOC family protein [Dehalococcoidia bacterium]|nr:VOC family protein [Dehalococcoidia bacterium]
MEPRISIVTLGVTDLPRSVQFYRDGLGLSLYDQNTKSIAFFRNRGTWLALYPREALAADVGISAYGSGFSGVTLAHNVRSKREVDELLQVSVEAGATLVKAAEDTFWGGYSGYFADPDNHLWEIAWNPHFWIE